MWQLECNRAVELLKTRTSEYILTMTESGRTIFVSFGAALAYMSDSMIFFKQSTPNSLKVKTKLRDPKQNTKKQPSIHPPTQKILFEIYNKSSFYSFSKKTEENSQLPATPPHLSRQLFLLQLLVDLSHASGRVLALGRLHRLAHGFWRFPALSKMHKGYSK